MGSQGIGTTPHVCGELLKMMTGIDFAHVPYRDSLMPDLLAGRVQFYFSPLPAAIGYLREGKLRALAMTTAMRSSLLPDVPTIGEFVPGYEATGWFGVCAPNTTATAIIDELNKEANTVVVDTQARARLTAVGVEPTTTTPAEFAKFISEEADKWAKVIKFANLKPE
jgi:tripartite-type tricarboxylate transporter receptor subunit TctC